MRDLVHSAMNVLHEMYDADTGRFSATTSVVGQGYASDFSLTPGLRYSVNSLLGLARARNVGYEGWDVAAAFDVFLENNDGLLGNAGDQGMLLWALAEARHRDTESYGDRVLGRAKDLIASREQLPLQEMCWILSGVSQFAALAGHAGAREASRDLYAFLRREYVRSDSPYPMQSPSRWRAPVVSFGGIVYYLRALWDYYSLTGDEQALTLFRELTSQVIGQQGRFGEWSWLYHTRSGRAVERYEVYSVHQEAMAMLFLLPALSANVEGAETAIRRSYRWIFGENELGVPMWRDDPLLVYRSIRRTRPMTGDSPTSRVNGLGRMMDRGWNLAHALAGVSLKREAQTASRDSVEINRECRSYEMGWTVYVWAGVSGFEEFTDIDSWTTHTGR